MFWQVKKHPLSLCLRELFKLLGIKVAFKNLNTLLLEHPNFPSLYAISGILSYYAVKNKGIRTSGDKLNQLETPFLAFSEEEEGLLIITKTENNTVTLYSISRGWRTVPLNDFLRLWNHDILIMIDRNASFEESNYQENVKKEMLSKIRPPILIVFFLLCLLYVGFHLGTVLGIVYLILKTLGFFVSSLLTFKLIYRNASFKFCNVTTEFDCDSVLGSGAAKLTNWLSLTDIGLIYYLGSLVLLFLGSLNGNNFGLTLLFLLSILSLPFTLFSIFYQAFKVKKWCFLCLLIMLTMWLEGIFVFYYYSVRAVNELRSEDFFLIIFSFLASGLLWFFVKYSLIEIKKGNFLKHEHAKLTNDFAVFEVVQSKQVQYNLDFQEKVVLVGNLNAENNLTIVLNPLCDACSKEFVQIYDLVKKHPEFCSVGIIFSVDINGDSNDLGLSLKLVRSYLSNSENFLDVLYIWFSTQSFTSTINVLNESASVNSISRDILESHAIWVMKNKIEFTPTIFFNNRLLSQNYSIQKIQKIIEVYNS